ncbi:MAG: anti-CBASS protein Acb1 family protein, partial [Candidatus Thorarchaeota archaeon]
VDERDDSLRYGQPDIYQIRRSADVSTAFTDAHWTKVILVATRLDEENYEGDSVLTPIYDDATGYRNMRWGEYQTIYRYGSGFPHIKIPGASKKQISNWIAEGEFDDIFSRTYFVSGGENEDIEFKGVQEVSLNPEPYNKMSLQNLAMGTRIPQDILVGATAGSISGSDVNERQYFKFISSEQIQVEPVVRMVLERLMDTGQIDWDYKEKPYEIVWGSAFEINKKDQATISLLEARSNSLKTQWMTVNEIRAENGLPSVPGGDIVIGLAQLQPRESSNPEKKEAEEEPSEEEEPEKKVSETRQRTERE